MEKNKEVNPIANMDSNYEEKRKDFDKTLDTYSNQMNEHFNSIFSLTNQLKNYEEFNMKEDDLKKKLEQLRNKNIDANKKMENKLKSIEQILSKLNTDNNMQRDINKREQSDDLDLL